MSDDNTLYYYDVVEFGKSIIYLGIMLFILGIIIYYQDAIPWIKHFGKLPGDIAIKKENYSFYFPIVSSILLSLLISLIFFLFRKL